MAIHIGQIEDVSGLPWRRHKQVAKSIRDFECHTGESIRFPFLPLLMCYRWYLLLPVWLVVGTIVFALPYLIPPIFGLSAGLIGWRSLRWSKKRIILLSLGALLVSMPAAAVLALTLPVVIAFLPHHYYAKLWLRHLEGETGTLAADPDAGLTENRVWMPGNPRDGYLLIREEVERVEFHGGTYLGILHTGSDELLDLAHRHWAFHWRYRELLPVVWDGEEIAESNQEESLPEETPELAT